MNLSPAVRRLIARAVVAGVTAGVAVWANTPNAYVGIVVAGVLAAAEVVTPINAIVGLFKQEAAKTPPTGETKP